MQGIGKHGLFHQPEIRAALDRRDYCWKCRFVCRENINGSKAFREVNKFRNLDFINV